MLLIYVFYLYIAVISLFALLSTLQALGSYREKKYGKYSPRTLVVLPCRGTDYKMDENLTALKAQDYGNYDIIAVVDSADDSAVKLLKQSNIKYMVAKKHTQGSGKVNAIACALEKFRNYDAYAIADSDILVKRNWLRDLVLPLKDKHIGLSTTYPYFKAEAGFWSKVKTVWSFVGDGMMESKLLRFGWGGSIAFRRDLVGKKELDFFRKFISDDVALTKIALSKGLGLAYVKGAKPTVRSKDDFKTFLEWSNRQTALSINGNRLVFWIGLPFYALTFILLVSAFALTLFYSYIFILLFVPVVLGAIKNYRRLEGDLPGFVFINAVMPLIFVVNLMMAKNMRRIRWRGRDYNLSSGRS